MDRYTVPMAASTHTFQAPRGTRDFYPHDLAVRRYIESVWREVSINHGFDEIDGPTFEHLELYTTKSGPGIVSELFSFKRDKGDTDYALRPEFTPTLARMYAAQAGSLPKPTKWFSIGPYFRAERPQRGRLREHIQLNVDIIGDDSPRADLELLKMAIGLLEKLGLTPQDVKIRLSDRNFVEQICNENDVPKDEVPVVLLLLDHREKLDGKAFDAKCTELSLSRSGRAVIDRIMKIDTCPGIERLGVINWARALGCDDSSLVDLSLELTMADLGAWYEIDSRIVRGLAYYTGTVFEIHETSGKERAIAGGGRYDNLVELFGGPPTAACGFAMGDVVLRLVLEDHGLLEPAEKYMPAPDVFVVNLRDDEARDHFTPLVSQLRESGLHVRHSYKSTRNVGKLLSEANKTRARFAVILGRELDEGNIVLKDLQNGEQEEIARDTLIEVLRTRLAPREGG